jgi:ABC-type ATPase involved in cell division
VVQAGTFAGRARARLACRGRCGDRALFLRSAGESVLRDTLDHALPIGRIVSDQSDGTVHQQQRVALARALAGRPDVLLADEPAAEQDPAHALDAILAAADRGAAVLLATHDAQVVRRCDRRLHVVDGALTDPETLA